MGLLEGLVEELGVNAVISSGVTCAGLEGGELSSFTRAGSGLQSSQCGARHATSLGLLSERVLRILGP